MRFSKERQARQDILSADGYKRRYGPGSVGRYYDDVWTSGCPLFSMFTFVKCFRQDPRELPSTLAEQVGPRLAPAPHYQSSSPLTDVRRDFVLPPGAPRTIASIAELIAAFDNVPPLRRDVMVEMKFILRASASPHCAYESVRGFALQHFAKERELAAMLVLHLPGRSGATGDNHIHLFVPARRLTPEGFTSHAGQLVHDQGFAEVTEAWRDWRNS